MTDETWRKEINCLLLETLTWGNYDAYAVQGNKDLIAINSPPTLFYVSKSPVPDSLPQAVAQTADKWHIAPSQRRMIMTDKHEPSYDNKNGWEIITFMELADICKAHRNDQNNDGLLKKGK